MCDARDRGGSVYLRATRLVLFRWRKMVAPFVSFTNLTKYGSAATPRAASAAYDTATCSGDAQFVPSAIESVGDGGIGSPMASA